MNLSFLPKRVGKILGDVGKGNRMVLRRLSSVEYNPYEADTNQGGTGEYVDYACEGVLMQPKMKRKKGGSEQDESCRVLLRADTLSIFPETGDTLIINDVAWTVVSNDPVMPAGTPIMHKLEVKP